MSSVIFFFGTGLAFFTGVGLLLTAILIRCRSGNNLLARLGTLMSIVGLVLVLLSAAPLPYLLYALGLTCTLLYLVGEGWQKYAHARPWLRILVVVVWILALVMEIPHLFPPHLQPLPKGRLVIVGDSVAAGAGEKGIDTWPRLLARDHELDVLDLSQPGATVRSAERRLNPVDLRESDLILLEIGGNDLLGSTTAADYAQHLEILLQKVCVNQRTVVMLELPLPPLGNAFGLAQRRLAAKYGVPLVPKWLFINVLTAGVATVDSIHLTQAGHHALADMIWHIVRSAYDE